MQSIDGGAGIIVFDVPVWLVIQLIAGALLPLVVGFITHKLADPGLKATLLIGLSTVTSLLTELADALQTGVTYNLGSALIFALITFLTAVGTLHGFYMPHGMDEAVAAKGFSIGRQDASRRGRRPILKG